MRGVWGVVCGFCGLVGFVDLGARGFAVLAEIAATNGIRVGLKDCPIGLAWE